MSSKLSRLHTQSLADPFRSYRPLIRHAGFQLSFPAGLGRYRPNCDHRGHQLGAIYYHQSREEWSSYEDSQKNYGIYKIFFLSVVKRYRLT